MKWQAIADATGKIKEEARLSYIRKLERDASGEVPYLWSDFILSTNRHLAKAEGNIVITNHPKTGSLTALSKFNELDEDFLEDAGYNGKSFLDYVIGKYDQRAADVLRNVKNPYSKRFLQEKMDNYRVSLATNISNTEAKLIDDRRYNMAIESIERLKQATYDRPELYNTHLQDSMVAITSLVMLPDSQGKLLKEAKEELAYAAALGALRQNPHAILTKNNNTSWQNDLSFSQAVRLEQQAMTLIQQEQIMKQKTVSRIADTHFNAILKTGQGINGFTSLLESAFSPDDPKLHYIKQQEESYKQAFLIHDQLRTLSLAEGRALLNSLKPKFDNTNQGESIDNINIDNIVAKTEEYKRKEELYHILVKEFDHQISLAVKDPARLVEELYVEEIPLNIPTSQRYLLRKQLQEQKGIPDYAQKFLMNDEKQEFLRKLNIRDVNQIREFVDSIITLADDETKSNYGLELMAELLENHESELLIHFYAENKLYNRKNADAFLEMLPVKEQLFTNQEKQEFNKAIEENSIFKDWSESLRRQDIRNQEEIAYRQQGIRYLARYYQNNEGLPLGKAVTKAGKKLITELYSNIGELYIPRQVIKDGIIHDINSEYIEANLARIKQNIIRNNNNIYDWQASFGVTPDADLAGKDKAIARVKEALAAGRWKMTPDQKSIYYSFLTADGSYRPLMQGSGVILKFDLLDINNPKGLEEERSLLLKALEDVALNNW